MSPSTTWTTRQPSVTGRSPARKSEIGGRARISAATIPSLRISRPAARRVAYRLNQRRDAGPELPEPLAVPGQPLLGEASAPVEADGIFGYVGGTVGGHDFAHVEVCAAHPQLAFPLPGEPARESGVIVVQMGGNNPGNGFALEVVGKDLPPAVLHLLGK